MVLLPVVMPLSGSQQDYFRNRPQQLQRRIDMKHLVLTALALVCLNIPAYAAGPDSFQCIRPDGSIVCTVNAPSGDPSVVCNHDCVDCNMTCVARQVVIREGDELIFNPGASRPVQPGQTGPGAVQSMRKHVPLQPKRQNAKQCRCVYLQLLQRHVRLRQETLTVFASVLRSIGMDIGNMKDGRQFERRSADVTSRRSFNRS